MENNQLNSRHDQWITRARRDLATRRGEKPLTKAGQLRAVWPEIQNALDDGQCLRSIRGWLEEQGVVLTIDCLRTYVSRIRRERRKKAAERFLRAAIATTFSRTETERAPLVVRQGPAVPEQRPVAAERPFNPLAQGMEALAKGRFDIRKIHGDGDPTGRSLV
jgi:hypothetical protein